jgi:hypothetical protein
MSRPDIDRVLERIREGTAERMRRLRAAQLQPVSSVDGTRVAHAIGTRVFDPHTGETGEVIGAGSENVVVPTTQR